MFMRDVTGLQVKTKVDVKCDDCGTVFSRTIDHTRSSRRRRKSDHDYCVSCSRKRGAAKRPQNTKQFWETHKQSDAYYKGIRNRPSITGEQNPMWGKKHTDRTKQKMSNVRTGKTGENATAWKGGRLSLNRRVKSALQRRYRWFHRVIERDGCRCQQCGATNKLDAHHIVPISIIIKKLLSTQELLTEADKMDWLIIQPEIVDNDLTNGITLCRSCHRRVHQNWGSHEPTV